jgi:hypothetical protein
MTFMTEINDNNVPSVDELIPLRKASEISGFSVQHLALLIRQGKLWGDRLGGSIWFTTEAAVSRYLSQDRKPGPKSG